MTVRCLPGFGAIGTNPFLITLLLLFQYESGMTRACRGQMLSADVMLGYINLSTEGENGKPVSFFYAAQISTFHPINLNGYDCG